MINPDFLGLLAEDAVDNMETESYNAKRRRNVGVGKVETPHYLNITHFRFRCSFSARFTFFLLLLNIQTMDFKATNYFAPRTNTIIPPNKNQQRFVARYLKKKNCLRENWEKVERKGK